MCVCVYVSICQSVLSFLRVSRCVYVSFHPSVLSFLTLSIRVYVSVRLFVLSLCASLYVYVRVRPSVI